MKDVTGKSTVSSEAHAYLNDKQTKDDIGNSAYRLHTDTVHTVVGKRHQAISKLNEMNVRPGLQ